MARPVKWRKVSFVPTVKYFTPSMENGDHIKETILKVEELEALRLKDFDGLDQDECAQKMEVSRATFQKILTAAREKVAMGLIKGTAIRIEGGSFTEHICHMECQNCGKIWTESCEIMRNYKDKEIVCMECGSNQIRCTKNCSGRNGNKNCHRYGRKSDL